jgi:(2Fe-2S) ferredoxin
MLGFRDTLWGMAKAAEHGDGGDALAEARAEAQFRGVGGYGRHIFICTGPDCCTPEEGLEAWTRLKSAVADLNKDPSRPPIYRTKVGCLRICRLGPTALVYPEGTWYSGARGAVLERIIREDLGEGRPVAENVIGRNPLGDALVSEE